MENYCEYLVKKKFTAADALKALLIIVALLFICLNIRHFLGFASALVVLAFGGYGAFMLITSLKQEFEYCFTDGHLDVDVIIAGRSRKRLCSFDIDVMELCAGVNNPDKKGEMSRSFVKKIEAASSADSQSAYFAVFSDEEGCKLLIFEPNEKILGAMSAFTRSKIFR